MQFHVHHVAGNVVVLKAANDPGAVRAFRTFDFITLITWHAGRHFPRWLRQAARPGGRGYVDDGPCQVLTHYCCHRPARPVPRHPPHIIACVCSAATHTSKHIRLVVDVKGRMSIVAAAAAVSRPHNQFSERNVSEKSILRHKIS